MKYKTIKECLFGTDTKLGDNYGRDFPGLVPIMFGPFFPLYYGALIVKEEISKRRNKGKPSKLAKLSVEKDFLIPK